MIRTNYTIRINTHGSHDIEIETSQNKEIFTKECPHRRINAFLRIPIKVGDSDCLNCKYCYENKKHDVDGKPIIKCQYGETK